MTIKEIARKYALKNASEHGEANPDAVIGKIFAEEEFEDKGEVVQKTQQVIAEVNQLSEEEIQDELKEYEFEEKEHEHDPIPDLQDAEKGEVVVRFAPNPNGPPTLGSSRGMVINGELKQKYDGKLILRYDDTDPRNKRPLKEAYEWYKEDYEWLGYEVDEQIYSSEQFDKYIKYAEELIEMEKAYVCSCDREKGSRLRSKGEACEHRSQSSEEVMSKWQDMKNGGLDEGDAVLKIKTDLDHKNPAVRDWVAFRIIEDPDHPITGDKYRVWPLLDFAGAIEDHSMGTTHIVRGKDLRASTKRQKFIYKYLGWDYPNIRYWGRVSIEGLETTMSTSSLAEMVKNNEIEGWDDPRAPTVRGFKRRGFQPQAIREFWIDMGVTEKDSEVSLDNLESYNREIVEDSADRYFFVKNPVEVTVKGLPDDIEPEMAVHPDYPERGERNPDLDIQNGEVKVLIEKEDLEDGFLRLKGFCNIEVDGTEAVYMEGDHREAVNRDGEIIHWVPEDADRAKVVQHDNSVTEGRVEPHSAKDDEVVQFERYGFVRCESSKDNKFFYTHS